MPGDRPWILLLAIALGIALRLWNAFYQPDLWLDEVFSAKLAESPLLDLLLAVPRFDTHPPLYYVQLHFWSLLSTGDVWMLLNSVLFDLLVILSLARLVGRVHGAGAGLWAAAIYAVLPLSVLFAENLRMYAMFFLLAVWLWYLLERRVAEGGASGRARLATILLGLAATLTHGLGFFVVFVIYLQAFVRTWRSGRDGGPRPALMLMVNYVPVALASLYSLGIGSFRQTEGLAALDLGAVGIHLTIAIFGMEAPAPFVVGYIGFVLLLVPPLFLPASRSVVGWLVLLPFAVLLLLSLTVKTVFMYRTLGLFSPFLAIALGLFFADGWREATRSVQALSVLVLVVFATAALNSSISFRKPGYRTIAAIWEAEAPDNAVLFVSGSVSLWGLTRYLGNVPDYSALEIQPPVRDGLLRVKQRLEGSWFARAGLFGTSDHLVLGGNREIWPYPAEDRLAEVPVYWVLRQGEAACLRAGDAPLRSFRATGQTLVECRRNSPEPG